MRLILASKSAARRAMLNEAGVSFEAVSAEIDEEAVKLKLHGFAAQDMAAALAEAKALTLRSISDALILGCDQTLQCESGEMLHKPESLDELATQLHMLSGTTHQLHSAAVVVENGVIVWRATESVSLRMRALSDAFIASYVRDYGADVMNCVGGYQIEGVGVQLFEQIEGSHFAILGLPLLRLLGYLRERGVLAT